ncbi:MAG: histidine phosphatase family protein [Kiritimatiellae bacterium]|nr:histidine phosphatase family protein [Kiritimatiellia bacterium]
MPDALPRQAFAEITVGELLAQLRRGARCALQVRHAERTKIDAADKSFGLSIPITPEGERTSERLGAMLAEAGRDVAFLSSPHLRTLMTARRIAAGMGLHDAEVRAEPRLGNGSFYFADAQAVYDTFTNGGFFDSCFRYFRGASLPGLADLREASDALEDWLLARLSTGLLVAVTHDSHIASFLSAKTDVVFSRENWPHFLDGAAVLVEPDGTRRYALVRTGLSAGISGIDAPKD